MGETRLAEYTILFLLSVVLSGSWVDSIHQYVKLIIMEGYQLGVLKHFKLFVQQLRREEVPI